ncbi:vexin [Gymnogyps californianus]|uniref:vexin n=1 Tax=Gymnogyps californianus TaxID=33616 RepID=UPI0021C95FFD|nr:vexin [Gymnogyps californianus]
MHQIYSCSDENLEVFTTVISSKSCSPARRRAKSTQHIVTKSVVAISDRRPHRTEKLQPCQGDLLQVLNSEDEVRGLGRLQSGRRGPCPAKGAAQHVGITERESSKSCNHLLDGKSLIPPSPVAHITVKAVAVTDSPAGNSTSTEDHRQRWRKTAEYDPTLPPGAEASLPLTGGNLCGTPSLLRKMWMKHKKKSEYLGATNSAFEAD